VLERELKGQLGRGCDPFSGSGSCKILLLEGTGKLLDATGGPVIGKYRVTAKCDGDVQRECYLIVDRGFASS
jgi:hypothetical protein